MSTEVTKPHAGMPAFLTSFIDAAPSVDIAEFEMAGGGFSVLRLQTDRDGSVKVKFKKETIHTFTAKQFPRNFHLVHMSKPRAMFVEPEQQPRCRSDDGVTGKGANGQDGSVHKCATCPQDVFGTGKEGRGKACKQTIAAVMMPNEIRHAGAALYIPVALAFWLEASEVKYEIVAGKEGQQFCKVDMAGVTDDNGELKLVPWLFKVTSSSFKPWTGMLNDIKAMGEVFARKPVLARLRVETVVEQIQGFSVGVWKFLVSPPVENSDEIAIQIAIQSAKQIAENQPTIAESATEADGLVSNGAKPASSDDIPY
jgi:hypothetical protein